MAAEHYNEAHVCMWKSCNFFFAHLEKIIFTEFAMMEISLQFSKTIIIAMEYALDYFQFIFCFFFVVLSSLFGGTNQPEEVTKSENSIFVWFICYRMRPTTVNCHCSSEYLLTKNRTCRSWAKHSEMHAAFIIAYIERTTFMEIISKFIFQLRHTKCLVDSIQLTANL